MGIPRASFAWLIAALTVGLVSGLPHVTLANDVGPGKEVRAIRQQLPVLLKGRLAAPALFASDLAIDSVVINGDAVVQWHSGEQHCTTRLSNRFRTWWITDDTCVASGDVNATQLTLPTAWRLDDLRVFVATMGDYQMRLGASGDTAPAGAVLADLRGRAPTEAESWMTTGGNSYFFFSGTVQSSAKVNMDAGTTIDVWFPFVLDTSLHYALTIAHADKPIGPIDGTLKDNVVHFVLPAFALAPGAELHGEVEGDAWLHQ